MSTTHDVRKLIRALVVAAAGVVAAMWAWWLVLDINLVQSAKIVGIWMVVNLACAVVQHACESFARRGLWINDDDGDPDEEVDG